MRAAFALRRYFAVPGDGKCLSRECLAQKCCERGSDGVFRALQWRIGFENSGAQLVSVGSEIPENCIHSGPQGDWMAM